MFNQNETGLTEIVNIQMSEFEETIYEIEDNVSDPQKEVDEIIAYLKDMKFSIPFGKALRRFICKNYAYKKDSKSGEYIFNIIPGKEIRVSDYHRTNYDIFTDDVEAYVELFMFINQQNNTNSDGTLLLDFPKAEARRLMKADVPCRRDKMFLISFALNMNSEETTKFLTDHLAEQTYNFRDFNEIIAFYCQTHKKENKYSIYLKLQQQYLSASKEQQYVQPAMESGYTAFAGDMVKLNIDTDEKLLDFLLKNQSNFKGYSQTAYNEFIRLLNKAKQLTKTPSLLNDEHLSDSEAHTVKQLKEKEERINNAIEAKTVQSNEQLAKEMLSCIPRYTKEYVRELKKNGIKTGEKLKVVENDFINIKNGERGQDSSKATTTLPTQITKNLLMSGRLNDLEKQRKPIERKDLVFLKFYIFSKQVEEKESCSRNDCQSFIDECNEILNICGFSRLYAANRFENLILISLFSSNPFEMFETIIEYSFFNEPALKEEI